LSQDNRQDRIRQKIDFLVSEEAREEIAALRARDDFFPELDYFLELLERGSEPETIAKRTGKPVVALMCLQAPLELFHAYGLAAFKIVGGSYAATRLSAPLLPAIMCPMLRSALGSLLIQEGKGSGYEGWKAWVVPTTCDWVVKIQDMMGACAIKADWPIHRLELPHQKDRPESQERWLEEVYSLRAFLRELTGLKKIPPKELAKSMGVFQTAWHVFSALIDLKKEGKVSPLWFAVMAGAFFYDGVENWTHSINRVLAKFKEAKPKAGPRVFLAGSPICFPNLKLLHLLEEAGLCAVVDDLCSSERLFPGAVYYDDPSEHGILKAMAQRYHQGCQCPTFCDNDRRINNILAPVRRKLYQGVVFHVLKGCHPFDLESLALESRLKEDGLKYLRLETDYTSEDGQTLLTRLEAYRSTLEG
jgi:benzoyl-CoA reductase/2-hydroxyglutaryl-CoA dehydratase subunit BcrC/BadD/HgdB